MRVHSLLALSTLSLLVIAPPAPAVTVDWVSVALPGNPCDPAYYFGCAGSVSYTYQIAKYEITNAQYTEFLNAVADTDANGLYDSRMTDVSYGGITRTGTPGTYTYSIRTDRTNWPVNYVSYYDALRFANWLNNGQPSGVQDASTTEDGAYTITASGIANDSITRNAGATIVLTNRDEWHKAAYFDGASASYFDYPARSDTPTACSAPTATPNRGNCESFGLVSVGSYVGSASPFGTFDQGGNVYEWLEESYGGGPVAPFGYRLLRGGDFERYGSSGYLQFESSYPGISGPASSSTRSWGFRLVMLPEPSTGLLVFAGLLGLAGWRRARD